MDFYSRECGRCKGKGYELHGFLWWKTYSNCSACGGTGKIGLTRAESIALKMQHDSASCCYWLRWQPGDPNPCKKYCSEKLK